MNVREGVKCKCNQICRLNKAIYGLEQAARCWFETFWNALLEKGFWNSAFVQFIYILDRESIFKKFMLCSV